MSRSHYFVEALAAARTAAIRQCINKERRSPLARRSLDEGGRPPTPIKSALEKRRSLRRRFFETRITAQGISERVRAQLSVIQTAGKLQGSRQLSDGEIFFFYPSAGDGKISHHDWSLTESLLGGRSSTISYTGSLWLRRERGDDFLEARVAAERVPPGPQF